jgi:hypothetical protein
LALVQISSEGANNRFARVRESFQQWRASHAGSGPEQYLSALYSGEVHGPPRPHVSNDNPYSEAQFKTLKYRPAFPERFGSLEDSRGACGDFFDWYNLEHHHSGLGLLTPHDVHHGLAAARVTERAATLASAWLAHPERFPRGKPVPRPLPTEAWINRPRQLAAAAPQPLSIEGAPTRIGAALVIGGVPIAQ